MTTETRSDYLGVYHNRSEASMAEVPFRVAIKLMRNGTASWMNCGYMASEKVAARVYNMYAVKTFGKGAIVNDVEPLTDVELAEFNAFIAAKPNRAKAYDIARQKARAIVEGGHKFKTNVELRAEQQPVPTAQADDGDRASAMV